MQFSLLWLGQNLINISVYAADAQARRLPLLGGNKVYHDWHYLLNEIGLLQYDAEVGYFFFGYCNSHLYHHFNYASNNSGLSIIFCH
jgi:hypothetical protein